MLRGREVLRFEFMTKEVGKGNVLVFCIRGGAGAYKQKARNRRTQR